MSIVLNSASALTAVGMSAAGLAVTHNVSPSDKDDKSLDHARTAMIVSIVLAGIWLLALVMAQKRMGPMTTMVLSIGVLVTSLISTMVATGVKTDAKDSSMEHTKQAAVVITSAMSGLLVGFAAGQPSIRGRISDSLSSLRGGLLSTTIPGVPGRVHDMGSMGSY